MPSVYLGHGAPPLVDDARWVGELAGWAARLPRPAAILVLSAHWAATPVTIGASRPGVPLTYDFWGFPAKYYRVRYAPPGAEALAERVRGLLARSGPIAEQPERGLDHGAYVPLTVMYPAADVPVLQVSLPGLEPEPLFALGRRLAVLREEGVLIMGSGFLTHGLPYIQMVDPDVQPPAWSVDFDLWATEALARGDVDQLLDYRRRAPGLRYAHPTPEHLVPLFVTLGAASPGRRPEVTVDGYWFGLAKRSFQID